MARAHFQGPAGQGTLAPWLTVFVVVVDIEAERPRPAISETPMSAPAVMVTPVEKLEPEVKPEPGSNVRRGSYLHTVR